MRVLSFPCPRPGRRRRRPATGPGAAAIAFAWMTLALVWAGGLPVPGARADDNAEARILFERGNRRLAEALVARGDRRTRLLEQALDAYVESLLLVRSRNAVFNAGVTLEALDRKEEAFAYFREYVGFPGIDDEERAEARARLDALRADIATVEVTTTPPGAAIRIDREDLAPLGETPAEVAVSPGDHVVILSLEGHRERRVPVEARRGSTASLVVELAPMPTPPDPAPAPSPPAIGRLLVESPDPVTVRVDDAVLGTGRRFAQHLPPGSHTVRAAAPGRVPATIQVDLAPGAELRLRPDLAEEVGDRRELGAWPAVTAGVAAATLTTAVGTAIGSVVLDDRYEERPEQSVRERGLRLRTTARVTFVAAAVLAVATLVLYLVDGDVPQPPSSFEVGGPAGDDG